MPIQTEEELRAIYAEPKEAVLQKILPRLEKHSRNFIAHSPFIVMATSDAKGHADASPKGDAPGFVHVSDDKTLLIPDRIGNNIADSLRNILENPEIGLIFFIPGIRETLRINGKCEIVSDTGTLSALEAQGKAPRSALKVTVREVYMHCGKSIIRSDLWGESNKIDRSEFPTLGKILADQVAGRDEAEKLDEYLEHSYKENLY